MLFNGVHLLLQNMHNILGAAVKALDKLFNPYTYHGAALTSTTAAYEMNRFKDNPTLENGAYVTMSFTPVAVKGAQAAVAHFSQIMEFMTLILLGEEDTEIMGKERLMIQFKHLLEDFSQL